MKHIKVTFLGIVIMVAYPIGATIMWYAGRPWTAATILSLALFVAYLTLKDADTHDR